MTRDLWKASEMPVPSYFWYLIFWLILIVGPEAWVAACAVAASTAPNVTRTEATIATISVKRLVRAEVQCTLWLFQVPYVPASDIAGTYVQQQTTSTPPGYVGYNGHHSMFGNIACSVSSIEVYNADGAKVFLHSR